MKPIKNKLKFNNKVLIRNPSLPISKLLKFLNSEKIIIDDIFELWKDDFFKAAIWHSSKTLFKEIEKCIHLRSLNNSEKIIESCIKYFSRLCSRSTPFGLFSGVAIGNIDKNNTNLLLSDEIEIHCDIDYEKYYELLYLLHSEKEILKNLRYSLNSTIYLQNDSHRFIEKRLDSNKKQFSYQLSRIDFNEVIFKIINNNIDSITYDELLKYISNETGYDFEDLHNDSDVIEFVNELVLSGILISNLELSTISDSVKIQIQDKLIDKKISLPQSFQKKIDYCIINSKIYSRNDSFEKLIDTTLIEENNFHISLVNRLERNSINESVIHDLIEAFDLLRITAKPYYSYSLNEFKNKFKRKYDKQYVKLTEVFDPEIGIEVDWHVTNMALSESNQMFQNLNKYVNEMTDSLQKEGILDLSNFNYNDNEIGKQSLPDTFSIIIELFDCSSKYHSHIFTSGHTSAVNFLSRFSVQSKEVYDLVKEISDNEKNNNSDVIIFDIDHIPIRTRAGNILNRKQIWDYEIDYLTNENSFSKKIALDDILVSVNDNDEIILKSIKHGKKLKPRVSTTIDYSNASPLFKFLGDVEADGKNISFGFNNFSKDKRHIPRIVYKKVILQPEIWEVTFDEFTPFYSKGKVNFEHFASWLIQRKIPNIILLTDGDHEILLNLKNNDCVNILIKTAKQKGVVILREYLFLEFGSSLIDKEKNQFANQIIVSIYKN